MPNVASAKEDAMIVEMKCILALDFEGMRLEMRKRDCLATDVEKEMRC